MYCNQTYRPGGNIAGKCWDCTAKQKARQRRTYMLQNAIEFTVDQAKELELNKQEPSLPYFPCLDKPIPNIFGDD